MSEFENRNETRVEEEEEDFDEEESETFSEIQLGFAEKRTNPLFLNRDWREWDGGRIGGLPVWLDYAAIPLVEDLQCNICNDPMSFLLEIYSPLDNIPSAFHRAVYVFCCKKPSCVTSNRGFKCFRSQLPKANNLYPLDPANSTNSKRMNVHLCGLCGCRAKSACSRCQSVKYCGKSHQKLHWKTHKKHCSENGCTSNMNTLAMQLDESQQRALFPEYEIVVEPEDELAAAMESKTVSSTSESLSTEQILDSVPKSCNVWEDAVTPGGEDEELDKKITQQDYNKALSEQKYDPVYINFLTRIDRGSTQQILRYNAGSLHRSDVVERHPDAISLEMQERGRLYVSRAAQQNATKVPCCAYCGSARALEFQIMPQILHYLEVEKNTEVTIREEASEIANADSDAAEAAQSKKSGTIENRIHDDLDWGAIDIYTCLGSCNGRKEELNESESSVELKPFSRYIQEHVELQDIPDLMASPNEVSDNSKLAMKEATI